MSLEGKRNAARGRMNRADKIRKELLSQLCRINAEYYTAKEEYLALDRQIAEQNVEVLPEKMRRGRPDSGEIDVDNLTADQIAMLEERLKQLIKEKEEDDDETSDED